MEFHPTLLARIEHCLPRQRGNVILKNCQVLGAFLYVIEHGCTWNSLPKHFGNWHTIYTRIRRWHNAGVLDRVFEELQREQLIRIRIDSPYIRPSPPQATTPSPKSRPNKPGKEASDSCDHRPRVHWVPRVADRP